MEMNKIEPTWEELLGSKNWEGLLEPLNLKLRQLILQCGDFCQANGDPFISDESSQYFGKCRHSKKSLLHKVHFQLASDYFVDTFLYAVVVIENGDSEVNWFGFIAVTSDEVSQISGRREIYVTWRGTRTSLEGKKVFELEHVSINDILNPDDIDNDTLKVTKGWFSIYTSDNPKPTSTIPSARTQLQTKIKELVERYKDDTLSIIFTGHSLGGALSVLSAFDVVENGLSDIPVTAFLFNCPKVGNKAFKEKVESFPNLRILHTKNKYDPVSPFPIENAPIGVDLVMDPFKSPYLKQDILIFLKFHDLQLLLHIVAGWNGTDGDFDLNGQRSFSLVNKEQDLLKDECMIPKIWGVEENKGMVINEDGEWIEAVSEEDCPVPSI